MGTGLATYDNPRKNESRNRCWNLFRQALPTRKQRRESTCVGLFGAEGLDVVTAERKGFDRYNLFNVEQDRNATEKARLIGTNTIRGNLAEVLLVWPESHPVNVVVADFTSGIERHVIRLAKSLMIAPALKDGCWLYVNLFRGREHSGWPDLLNSCRNLGLRWDHCERNGHFQLVRLILAHDLLRSIKFVTPHDRALLMTSYGAEFVTGSTLSAGSYLSPSGKHMDWACIRCPPIDDQWRTIFSLGTRFHDGITPKEKSRLARAITAARAVATRRKRDRDGRS